MSIQKKERSIVSGIKDYVGHLPDASPEWRIQAGVWGIIIVVVVAAALLFAVLALSAVFGGGSITYEAKGSPGPVTFSHYSHMWFQGGKYKDCKTCHDKLFAAQKYGTYVMRALDDSPTRKIRIGRDASTLYVPGIGTQDEEGLVTYEVPRVCRTCATGSCHDGKESFGRLDCLGCHKTK